MLENAKRPLILAGHGVRLSGSASKFLPWIESLGIPVVTTWNAMDLIPYDHPLCVGRPGVVALRAPNFAVQNCDYLLAIGCRLDPIVTAFNPVGFAPHARKIVVDIEPHPFQDAELITMDAGLFMAASSAKSGHIDAWIKQCQDWKRRYPAKISCGQPLSNYEFVDALSAFLPNDALIVTGSSGLAVEAFYQTFRNKPGQRIMLTAGLGAMGYGLPAAIGAAFASGTSVICLESDGSLQLNMQELSIVKEHNLPICLVVMNNQGYASIRATQRNYFDSRFVGTNPALPNLEHIAHAYGLPYRCVKDTLHLSHALHAELPAIIDVQIVHDETLTPKVSAIPQPDGSMLSMPLEDMTPLLPIEILEREMLYPLNPASYKARGL